MKKKIMLKKENLSANELDDIKSKHSVFNEDREKLVLEVESDQVNTFKEKFQALEEMSER